jgi:hypothetical protein
MGWDKALIPVLEREVMVQVVGRRVARETEYLQTTGFSYRILLHAKHAILAEGGTLQI